MRNKDKRMEEYLNLFLECCFREKSRNKNAPPLIGRDRYCLCSGEP